MLQASPAEREMGPAFRNRTTASRASELDKITPYHSFLADWEEWREDGTPQPRPFAGLSLVHKLFDAGLLRKYEMVQAM